MRISLWALIVFLLGCGLAAQQEASHWFFGRYCTLDFTQNPYDGSGHSELHSLEGSACWSDPKTGQLLFYSDGHSIWDAGHELMPSSNPQYSAHPNYRPLSYSTSQAALVVPHPGDPNKFYIFNPGNYTSNSNRQDPAFLNLSYKLVDLDLRGGRGDVVESRILLQAEEMGERLTGTIACARGGYWILCANAIETRLYAFLVDADGVRSSPVVSSLSGRRSSSSWSGVMKLSPDGTLLAFGSNPYDASRFEIYDFDVNSGEVRNPRVIPLDDFPLFYGLSFSPDSRRLYACGNSGVIDQYSLDPADQESIAGSRLRLSEANYWARPGLAQLGPDGRIYLSSNSAEFLLVINNPNARGTAADLTRLNISVGHVRKEHGFSTLLYGIPNYMDYIFAPDRAPCLLHEIDFDYDTVCEGDCAEYTVNSSLPADRWEWEFEGGEPRSWSGPAPPPVCYAKAGNYLISLRIGQGQQEIVRERRIAVYALPQAAAGEDLVLCRDSPGRLQGSGDGTVEWSPAEGLSDPTILDPVVQVTEDREYTLRITSVHGCVSTASVKVRIDRPRASVAGVAAICPGQSVQLSASANGPFEWSPTSGLSDPASLSPSASPRTTTVYTLRTWLSDGCSSSASVEVPVHKGGRLLLSVPDTSSAPGAELRLPLVAEAPADQLPLALGRSAFRLRYDARVLTFRTVEAGSLTGRSLDGSDEIVSLELLNPTIDQPRDTIAYVSLIGLIGLEDRSLIGIDEFEADILDNTNCLDLQLQSGSVLLDNYCLGYAVNFAARLQMRVYPNPASNNPQLELRNLNAAPAALSLRDMFGREIWRHELPPDKGEHRELTIPAASLTPGLYFISLLHGGMMHRRQLLITR